MTYLTKEQVNKKYKGKHIEIYKTYDYTNQCWMYEVLKVHRKPLSAWVENTTLGEDVGTEMEYCR